jgi:hypothetical protein
MSSDVEDTIEVIETAPVAPQARQTGISSYPKERIIATKGARSRVIVEKCLAIVKILGLLISKFFYNYLTLAYA